MIKVLQPEEGWDISWTLIKNMEKSVSKQSPTVFLIGCGSVDLFLPATPFES